MNIETRKQLCILLSVLMFIALFISDVLILSVNAQHVNMTAAQSISTVVAKDIGGHWAEKQIKDWNEKGFIKGYSDNTFKPNNTITRAEFITLVNNVFGYKDKAALSFTDIKRSDWYYGEIAKAIEAGYVKGYADGTIKPNNEISRQEVAMVISNIMRLDMAENSAEISKLKDNKDIQEWSKGAIGAVLDNGYMKGYTDQTFKTGNSITRAEATVALNNVTGSIYNKPGTYGDTTVEGNVSVSSDSVNLKNLNIKGNLYLTEGIGDGTVVLDNVTVSGKTLVCGGGMESIIIKNSTLGATVVQKKDGKVRLEASGKTKVGKMQLRSGGKLEEKDLSDAGFEDVEVKKDKSDAIVQFDGDFNNVDILSESKIEVTKGNIAKLQANEGAKDTEIKVLTGKIESIEIKVKVKVELSGGTIAKVTIDKASTGTIVDVKQGATITSLVTEAVIEVLGKGKVEVADVKISGVKFEIEPVKVIVANDIKVQVGIDPTSVPTTVAEVTPTPTSSGSSSGGGGGSSSSGGSATTPRINTSLDVISAFEDAVYVTVYNEDDGKLITNLTVRDFTLSIDSDEVTLEEVEIDNDIYIVIPYENLVSGTYTLRFSKSGYISSAKSFEMVSVSGISIEPEALDAAVGETRQILATVEPENANNKGIIWSTNNAEIATVDDTGMVTGVGLGSTFITATSVSNSAVNRTIPIIVGPDLAISDGSIAIGDKDPSITLSMTLDTFTAAATNMGNWQMTVIGEEGPPQPLDTIGVNNVTITMEESAGVAKEIRVTFHGTITGKGTLLIAANGSVFSQGFGSSVIQFQIEDERDTINVSDINVTSKETAITTDGGTLQMEVDVQPSNASNKSVTWTVTNIDDTSTDKATISEMGLLTALKDGEVKVVATAQDGSLIAGSITIAISGQGSTEDLDFVPGEGGEIAFTPFAAEANKIGGLYIEKNHDYYSIIFNGSPLYNHYVEMKFIPAEEIGATGYKLQYSENSGSTWLDYPEVTINATQDNVIVSNPAQTTIYRLVVVGGDKANYTSNEVTADIPTIKTEFTGYFLDQSMFVSGVIAPWVGRGLKASFTAVKQNYPEPNTVSEDVYMTYQWYRVNPVSYEMTSIEGATDLTYITTGDDVGYNLLVRATGDNENISGFIQVMSSWGVLEQNNACISNATSTGFTLNLYKTVPGLTVSELSLIDYNGDSVTINSVTQGANAAIYNISANLDPAKGPFYLSNNSDFWRITSEQEGHMMISEGVQIPYSVERYDIIVADVVGGAASVGTTPNIEAAEGEIITVYILNIEEGKEFKSITVTGVESGEVETTPIAEGAEYTFTMPAEEVTVTVVIE